MTDVILPGLSGLKLADELAQSRPELKVLFVSGYTDDEIGQRGIVKADTTLLPKTFSQDELTRKVRVTLDSPAVSSAQPQQPIGVLTETQ